ncbi:MAG: hypothetical protein AB1634_19195 [Thermodesulfobacteriota bacterium]
MKRQIEMENNLMLAHREFVTQLTAAVTQLENDIAEAKEMTHICTDEWCRSTESVIDELHKAVYAISEPRWATPEDSERIHSLRRRVRDLYLSFTQTTTTALAA